MIDILLLLSGAAISQVKAPRFDLDPWLLAPTLSIIVSAIAIWGMRLRIPILKHVPAAQRPFWAAFSLGQSLWATSATYLVLARLSPDFRDIPVAQIASLAALGCWIAALLFTYRYVPLSMRPGSLLDAFIVILCGLTLLEYFFGVSRWLAQPGGLDWYGRHIVPSLLLTWRDLYFYGALALAVVLILTRYMAHNAIPASHSVAMAAMLATIACNVWVENPGQSLPGLLLPPGAVSTYAQISATGQILAATLAVLAVYLAVYRPQPYPRARWSVLAPRLTLGAALALLALFATSVGPSFLLTAMADWATYLDVGKGSEIILAMALTGLTLALMRGGMAAIEVERLRRERIQLASRNEEYVRLAISDPLTRLFNKGYFQYRLDVEWVGSQRHDQQLTLIALDLDNFKQVNDRYGHSMGDKLLADVGQVIRSTVRVTDCACRVGGDEFVIIAPQTDSSGALVLAERLRVGIVRVLHRLDISPLVSVSCGISCSPDTANTAADLLEQADAALYKAKQGGKNRVVLWTPHSASEAATQPVQRPTLA